jgi:hypothetical protein
MSEMVRRPSFAGLRPLGWLSSMLATVIVVMVIIVVAIVLLQFLR